MRGISTNSWRRRITRAWRHSKHSWTPWVRQQARHKRSMRPQAKLGPWTSQEAKCVQEIEQCLTRKDYAGAAARQAELVQRRSATGHEKREAKQRNGEKNERERKAKEEEYARNIDELLAQNDYAGAGGHGPRGD